MIDHSRIEALVREHIEIVPYSREWPVRYSAIEDRLLRSLPVDLCSRISHIGSTAVPGLSAKPIIDVQVEVTNVDRVRREAVPILQDLGYEFIWRPTMGERAPYYVWFIGRNAQEVRTEHIHMVEPDAATEARILFRDFLRTSPQEAMRYEALKRSLHAAHANDRAAYTNGKTDYIASIVTKARAASP